SFVYQIADADIPASVVAEDPISKILALDTIPSTAIPAPLAIFAPRVNSAGLDLTDPIAFPAMNTEREAFRTAQWHAEPLFTSPFGDPQGRVMAAVTELKNP